jgi:hypothetical protein
MSEVCKIQIQNTEPRGIGWKHAATWRTVHRTQCQWNGNINVVTNFVLTLYKHEVCNIKQVLKTSEAYSIEGLILIRFC